MLAHRRSIEKELAGSRAPESLKEKLRLVQEIRAFAFERMALRRSRDYSTYYPARGRSMSYVVSASEKLRFERVQWWFPVIGRLPYKGYFDEKDARKEKARLERKGYDAYLTGVAAYNTPLWFSDPVPSTALDEPPGELAALLIHELAHGTVFFKNEAGFDEALATFVGDQGAEDFLSWRFGPLSPELAEFRASRARQKAFTKAIDELYERLDALYRGPAPNEEKLKVRLEIFSEGRKRLEKPGGSAPELNNAMILAHRLYHEDLGDFAAVYEKNGRDWPKTIAILKSLHRRAPRQDLKSRL